LVLFFGFRSTSKGCRREEFLSDQKTIDAVVRNLEIVGEAAARLSFDAREQGAGAEWSKIIGLRNRIVHEYSASIKKLSGRSSRTTCHNSARVLIAFWGYFPKPDRRQGCGASACFGYYSFSETEVLVEDRMLKTPQMKAQLWLFFVANESNRCNESKSAHMLLTVNNCVARKKKQDASSRNVSE